MRTYTTNLFVDGVSLHQYVLHLVLALLRLFLFVNQLLASG
jgi:hypothetical protein